MAVVMIDWSLTQWAGNPALAVAVLIAGRLRDAVGKYSMNKIDRDKAMRMVYEQGVIALPSLVQTGMIRDYQFVCDKSVNTSKTRRGIVFHLKLAMDFTALSTELPHPLIMTYSKDEGFKLAMVDNEDCRRELFFARVGKVLCDRFMACLHPKAKHDYTVFIGSHMLVEDPEATQDQIEEMVDKHFPKTPELVKALKEAQREADQDVADARRRKELAQKKS